MSFKYLIILIFLLKLPMFDLAAGASSLQGLEPPYSKGALENSMHQLENFWVPSDSDEEALGAASFFQFCTLVKAYFLKFKYQDPEFLETILEVYDRKGYLLYHFDSNGDPMPRIREVEDYSFPSLFMAIRKTKRRLYRVQRKDYLELTGQNQ